MPLNNFICPDKGVIPVQECLEKCRLGKRCLTLPTLSLISQEREWAGIASTTQLLNGTMLEFLKLTKPYNIDPDSRTFMLSGTKHHKALEDAANELGVASEVALSVDRDIFDLIEVENGKIGMTDYKLWGSYRIAKALGMTKVGTKPDPSGAVYKTTSKWGKAGEPKMVSVFQAIAENADNWEAEYQQNRYRVMLKKLGITLDWMQLQVTVRDGGLAVARNRGLERNSYIIPIKFIPDETVESYFSYKNDCLMKALKEGWTEPCTPQENWDGERCGRYCDVWEYCPLGLEKHNKEQGEDYA